MHLVIYFCGTGEPGDDFSAGYDYTKDSELVRTLFVEGCDNPDVCDAHLFPDLNAFAQRFGRAVFRQDHEGLKLTSSMPQRLQVGVSDGPNNQMTTVKEGDTENVITGITLCGYSRGAVTCFEVAKQLEQIAPNVPVDIVANQPVPGNSYQGPGTNVASIADCSKLTNLRNVSIILGSYTGQTYNRFGLPDDISTIHRGFFSQVVPKLPRTVKRDLIVIPTQSHHYHPAGHPGGEDHLNMQVAKYLHGDGLLGVDGDRHVKLKTLRVRLAYGTQPATFPKVSKLQSFFGISRKELYRYTDKQHSKPGLREGFEWDGKEALSFWWERQEKESSRYASQLTKQLTRVINTPIEKDMTPDDQLVDVFRAADRWLMLKAGKITSRYYQVEALRNNIAHHLISKDANYKGVLSAINRDLLKETNYFAKRWTSLSKEASWFKTEATRDLDLVFARHGRGEATDDDLITAMDTWLEAKKHSTSKRYDFVIRLREEMQVVVEKKLLNTQNPLVSIEDEDEDEPENGVEQGL